MAGGSSTPEEKTARPAKMEALRAEEAVKLSAAEQKDAQKRDAIFAAVMAEVRAEILFVFGRMVNNPIEVSPREQALQEELGATSIEKFLRDGTTLVSRNPVDMDGAARGREYVLANRLISAKGVDDKAMASEGIEKGNEGEGQDPLNMYMDGFKLLLEKLFQTVSVGKMKEFEVKVVGTDSSNVVEETRNHFIVHEGLSSFIPQAASSKETK